MWICVGDNKEFLNTSHITHISNLQGDPSFKRYIIYFTGGEELVIFEKDYPRQKLINQVLEQEWQQKRNSSSLA